MLSELCRHAGGTNMPVEGLLSQIKNATPSNTSRGRSAEAQLHLGLLTQLMHGHLADGKPDSRKVVLKELEAVGVPLQCGRAGLRRPGSRPGMA